MEIIFLLFAFLWIGWVLATWAMIGYGVKQLFSKRKD